MRVRKSTALHSVSPTVGPKLFQILSPFLPSRFRKHRNTSSMPFYMALPKTFEIIRIGLIFLYSPMMAMNSGN
jgi:hypothetical protein